MRQFFLFRHGQTDWNLKGIYQGNLDIPLNPRGRKEAFQLAQSSFLKDLDIIYSSDLKRAWETAQIIGEKKRSLPIVKAKELRELYFGKVQGVSPEERERNFPSQKPWSPQFCNGPERYSYRFPHGENIHQGIVRFQKVIRHILGNTSHQRIGICTHGAVLRNFLSDLFPNQGRPIEIKNCSLFQLTVQKTPPTLQLNGPLQG
jgi:probable phosphoglycerate mutase